MKKHIIRPSLIAALAMLPGIGGATGAGNGDASFSSSVAFSRIVNNRARQLQQQPDANQDDPAAIAEEHDRVLKESVTALFFLLNDRRGNRQLGIDAAFPADAADSFLREIDGAMPKPCVHELREKELRAVGSVLKRAVREGAGPMVVRIVAHYPELLAQDTKIMEHYGEGDPSGHKLPLELSREQVESVYTHLEKTAPKGMLDSFTGLMSLLDARYQNRLRGINAIPSTAVVDFFMYALDRHRPGFDDPTPAETKAYKTYRDTELSLAGHVLKRAIDEGAGSMVIWLLTYYPELSVGSHDIAVDLSIPAGKKGPFILDDAMKHYDEKNPAHTLPNLSRAVVESNFGRVRKVLLPLYENAPAPSGHGR